MLMMKTLEKIPSGKKIVKVNTKQNLFFFVKVKRELNVKTKTAHRFLTEIMEDWAVLSEHHMSSLTTFPPLY